MRVTTAVANDHNGVAAEGVRRVGAVEDAAGTDRTDGLRAQAQLEAPLVPARAATLEVDQQLVRVSPDHLEHIWRLADARRLAAREDTHELVTWHVSHRALLLVTHVALRGDVPAAVAGKGYQRKATLNGAHTLLEVGTLFLVQADDGLTEVLPAARSPVLWRRGEQRAGGQGQSPKQEGRKRRSPPGRQPPVQEEDVNAVVGGLNVGILILILLLVELQRAQRSLVCFHVLVCQAQIRHQAVGVGYRHI
mmetsp:Transcript_90169/g.232766  ORF Transcript_90169/g.232766 Transcript_90169/m.232766 type:complete len:250 (-) Transcript_90169:99-848(-)